MLGKVEDVPESKHQTMKTFLLDPGVHVQPLAPDNLPLRKESTAITESQVAEPHVRG
jgi:hypothetical protein